MPLPRMHTVSGQRLAAWSWSDLPGSTRSRQSSRRADDGNIRFASFLCYSDTAAKTAITFDLISYLRTIRVSGRQYGRSTIARSEPYGSLASTIVTRIPTIVSPFNHTVPLAVTTTSYPQSSSREPREVPDVTVDKVSIDRYAIVTTADPRR